MKATMEKVKVNPEVLDFLYGHVRDAPERQIADGRSHDAKMVWIFGAATVVIGLAGFSSTQRLSGGDVVTALLITGLVLYIIVAFFAISALWPREFWRSVHADSLWREYWRDSPDDTKHALIANIAEAYPHNREILSTKEHLVRCALVATAMQTSLVGAALVFARLA